MVPFIILCSLLQFKERRQTVFQGMDKEEMHVALTLELPREKEILLTKRSTVYKSKRYSSVAAKVREPVKSL
jgi:hypothetical protein